MKKILLLFAVLLSISSSYAQRKSSRKADQVQKIEYIEIAQILSNQDDLKLTQQQIGTLTIKNEYIKRDLQNLNSKTKMEKIEKKMHQRNLFTGYNEFINRTLTEDQLENWTAIKKEIAASEENNLGLKAELKELDEAYKKELEEVYRKHKADRNLYYASRSVVKKQYATDKSKIYAKYNVTEETEEGEKVLTLEEIANLSKEYDEYYNEPSSSNALEYLDIKEEYPAEEETILEEGDF